MRARWRNLVLAVVTGGLRLVLGVLSRVVPQSRSVVVSGFPEAEGNAVETARALLDRYPGRVVWLRDAGPAPEEVRALADRGLRLVGKAGLAGLWAYLRAEAVFFTHGLYGSPRPAPGKPLVNLWHGDGPKDVTPGRGVGAFVHSTYLVGSTPLFSVQQGAIFGVPPERVLVTGNPRTDQFWRPVDADRLAALGVQRDFVVWMPTFRRVRAVGAVRVEPADLDAAEPVEDLPPQLVAGLRARGMQLVVKPHPMDAERRVYDGVDGVVTVAEDDLVGAGVSLYELLGASAGLVTDYSSVWVDYLLLDRPMAFLVTDRGSYRRSLFPADVLDWLPGELVEDEQAPFGEFLADLDAAGAHGALQRKEVAERIGLNPTRTSAEDLVSALTERGVLPSTSLRGRRNGRSSSR